MPRRKQDCPKRMKWEEEMAAAAAARQAAVAAGLDPNQLPVPEEFDPEADPDQSQESRSSASSPAPDDEDEDETLKQPTKAARKSSVAESPSRSSPSHIMSDPGAAAAAAAAMGMNPAAANLQNLQALLAASAAFPGLFGPGNAAAGLLSSLPGGIHSALAMQGFQGLFGGLPAAAAAAAAAATGKIPANVMSPPAGSTPSPVVGRNADASSIIDFSSKRSSGKADKESDGGRSEDHGRRRGESTPLDLSGGTRKRDRSSSDRSSGREGPVEKRRSDVPSVPGWKASQSAELWNGFHKSEKNAFATPDASKALERMTELTRLSGETRAASGGGRQSAWQSHWLSKGADTAKDVLKCVWCKLSFESLAALTTHMKESKHCGVNASLMSSASSASGLAGSVNSSPSVASSPSSSQHPPTPSPSSHSDRPAPATSTNSGSARSSSHDLLAKDGTVQLPRKLVRGQDVWLGKGAEQTRQILKCMWCGQSFRSLAEMTTHMQQTQHYTNIISQEQIISWKAADGEKGSGGDGGGGGGGGGRGGGDRSSGGGGGSNANHSNHGSSHGQAQNQSHVNAVLTCKVCDQAFSSLKELSSHMVKNSHYKEHIMRSISETGGRRRQARDKRKKALPVRKLLELERAQQEARTQQIQQQQASRELFQLAGDKLPSVGRISCEKCGEKIETSAIVEHIRQCVGSQKLLGTSESKSSTPSPSVATPKSEPGVNGSGRKTPRSNKHSNPSPRASPMSVGSASGSDAPSASASTPVKTEGSSPSVLNAIEKLIEKSFDAGQGAGKQKGAAGAPNPPASNILRRLGIDDSIDYSKPLMDPLMTVNMLRLYGYGQPVGQRERTTSEASSSNASAANNGDGAQPSSQQRDSGKSTPRSTNEGGSPARSRSRSNSPSANSPAPSNRRHKEASPSPGSPATDADQPPASPAPSTISERSLRSATPATQISSPDGTSGRRSQTQTPTDGHPARSSLNALSSMFDGLASTAGGSSGTSGGFNPLAALQKLCDKTETHSPASSSGRPSSLGAAGGSGSAASSNSNGSAAVPNPGAILAFSWACNDAVMTDSIMKCAFCDTQFISKGAYRHHLSKMHFVKDAAGANAASGTPKASSGASKSGGAASSSSGGPASASASPQPPPGAAAFEESPHSKFLKYTELAKQLSSKYV